MQHEYQAPWGRAVKVATLVSVLLFCAIAVYGSYFGPRQFMAWRFFTLGAPVAGLALGVLFLVRGYALAGQELEIERFGWVTRLSLVGLESVASDSQAFVGTSRVWGNGGLFALTGLYWNRRLGRFRAWATDPARSVVLKFADRTVVLTPDDPRRFVSDVSRLCRLATDASPPAN